MLRTLRLKMGMLRLCAIQIRYVATIGTQNGYVATLCDRNICATLHDAKHICCDFVRLNKGMLQPLWLKMGMLQLCATEKFVRLCGTQKGMLRPLRLKMVILRLCATQASCGMIEFRLQEVHFGNPFRSQHESRTSTREYFCQHIFFYSPNRPSEWNPRSAPGFDQKTCT